MNKNVLYTAKYPVTYWQTEGENLRIYTFYSKTQYFHVHIDLKTTTKKTKTKNSYQHSSGKDKGFGMAKATDVLAPEAPEGN